MFHVEQWSEPDLPEALAQIVPRGTIDRLIDLSELVKKWNPKINLVAKSTIDDLWQRHIIDSLQILTDNYQSERWCDIGSGGGFPGLIVAIVKPDTQVTLIESDQRKCAFLIIAKQRLGLTNVDIRDERVEDVEPLNADTVSARALAPLDKLLPLAALHMAENGRAILMKGAAVEQEITDAKQHWDFQITRQSSITDPDSSILIIRNIQACHRNP
ncbi:MAG: 16S rRNA (guanine(527)-N(7))-methyltransferase RsmG [Deltaproteobacteria bacterium]